MARYGWQIFSASGQLVTDDTFFNCYHLDSGYLQVGGSEGNTASYAQTFPAYIGSEVRVVIGTGALQSGQGSNISVIVDTVSGGVPRVRITETRGNAAGCGSTFWVIATRIPTSAPIADSYGLGLFDAVGSLAFVPGATPFRYLGTAIQLGSTAFESPVGSDSGSSGSNHFFETNSPEMPICFVTTKSGGQAMAKAGAVRPSLTAPVSKNYRWCVGIASASIFGGVAPAAQVTDAVFHMFQPGQLAPVLGTGKYGVSLFDGGGPLDLAESDVLTLRDRAASSADFVSVGGDYRIYATGSGRQAMVPMPLYFNQLSSTTWQTVEWLFVQPGGSASNYWRLREYQGSQSPHGANYVATGQRPDWYRNRLLSQGISFNTISLPQYI